MSWHGLEMIPSLTWVHQKGSGSSGTDSGNSVPSENELAESTVLSVDTTREDEDEEQQRTENRQGSLDLGGDFVTNEGTQAAILRRIAGTVHMNLNEDFLTFVEERFDLALKPKGQTMFHLKEAISEAFIFSPDIDCWEDIRKEWYRLLDLWNQKTGKVLKVYPR